MHKFHQFHFFFFFFLLVSLLQFSIVLFVIQHQFSNSNYVVSGFRLKNFRYRFQRKFNFTIIPEEGRLLLEHSLTFFFYSDQQFNPTHTKRKIVHGCMLEIDSILHNIHPPRNNQIRDTLDKKKIFSTRKARKSNNFKCFVAVNFDQTRFKT